MNLLQPALGSDERLPVATLHYSAYTIDVLAPDVKYYLLMVVVSVWW